MQPEVTHDESIPSSPSHARQTANDLGRMGDWGGFVPVEVPGGPAPGSLVPP